MMEQLIDVTLAGLTLPCALRFPETAVFPPPDPAAPRVGIDPVRLSREDWDHFLSTGMAETPQTEYSLLTASFSDALMEFNRLIIHGVALRWQEHAYLICAASGVGKSTQARWLQTLRPSEFGIICGDRPILEFCHCEPVTDVTGAAIRPPVTEGSILVHPSPWNGKENWYGAEAAPLAGLILLERGDENRLCTLSPREAALAIYSQIIQTCVTAEGIRKAAELATRLLNAVPIWKLTTHQVPDSTKLLLDTVFCL